MTMDVTARVSASINSGSQQYERVPEMTTIEEGFKETLRSRTEVHSIPKATNYFENITLLPKRNNQKTKRSFDVAFLITPDENLTKKQAVETEIYQPDYRISPVLPTQTIPENLIIEENKGIENEASQEGIENDSIKSAFRKVGLQKNIELKYSQSPSSVSSISGGCSYQESRSPSPNSIIDPVRTPSPQRLYEPNFKTKNDIYPQVIPNSLFSSMDLFLKQKTDLLKNDKRNENVNKNAGKKFNDTVSSAFSTLAAAYPFPAFHQTQRITQSDVSRPAIRTTTADLCNMDKPPIFNNVIPGIGLNRSGFLPTPSIFGNNLLAAQLPLTASLLPSSLAALTLPAQNVCAKCNVSFRMTSDLVYHMRSHHKSDHSSSDLRRRRESDKLRCPVCNESFRERHHLTRHMTAHQDKEGDEDDDVKSYNFKNKSRKSANEFEK